MVLACTIIVLYLVWDADVDETDRYLTVRYPSI
jgi:hypothetical protein